jgi:hypothetical protein
VERAQRRRDPKWFAQQVRSSEVPLPDAPGADRSSFAWTSRLFGVFEEVHGSQT